MLRFLLDEHLSSTIAEQIRNTRPDIKIVGVQDWENGIDLEALDDALSLAAREQGLTLVAYDQRTVPTLLKL